MLHIRTFKKTTIISAVTFLLIFLLWKSQILTLLLFPDQTWELRSASNAIAFSSDGTMLATGAGKPGRYKIAFNHYVSGVSSTVEIRRVADRKVIQILSFPNATSLTFSPDNKLIAAGHRGREIKVWQVSNGKLVSTFEQSDLNFSLAKYLAFAPDGQTLVSFTQKYSSLETKPDTIDVWNIDSEENSRILSKHFSCVSISPNGKLLATGSPDKVRHSVPLSIHKLENGTLSTVSVLDNQPKGCREIQFSQDSQSLSFLNLEQKKIDVYNVETGKLIRSQDIKYIENENLRTNQSAFSQDADYLAIAYSAASIEGGFIFPNIPKAFFGRIRIWNTKNGNLIKTVLRSNKGSNALAFSPDGKLIASAEKDNTIRLWKISSNNYSWLWLLSSAGLIALAYWRRKNLVDWINR